MTADGAVRIVNACTNPDLFWALKGGGGGSFGVVTGLTLKIRELAERAGAAIFTVKAMSGLAFRELIRKFVWVLCGACHEPALGRERSIFSATVRCQSQCCRMGWTGRRAGGLAAVSRWDRRVAPRLPADRQTNHRRHGGPRLVGR